MSTNQIRSAYLLLMAAFCALLLSACAQPKSLVYKDLQSFRVQNVNLRQATVVLDLKFYNPNNYGLSLKNGDLDAYLNNKYLGKATLDERTVVPALDTFILPVAVTANLENIVTNAVGLLSNRNQEMLVRLQGNVRAGRGGIFIGVPVRYEGKQRIRL